MIEVCSKCYNQLRHNTEDSERLRRERCCNPVQHQWSNKSQQYNSVCTTVINAAGIDMIRLASYIALWL